MAGLERFKRYAAGAVTEPIRKPNERCVSD